MGDQRIGYGGEINVVGKKSFRRHRVTQLPEGTGRTRFERQRIALFCQGIFSAVQQTVGQRLAAKIKHSLA
jgi:hypothetical protein